MLAPSAPASRRWSAVADAVAAQGCRGLTPDAHASGVRPGLTRPAPPAEVSRSCFPAMRLQAPADDGAFDGPTRSLPFDAGGTVSLRLMRHAPGTTSIGSHAG